MRAAESDFRCGRAESVVARRPCLLRGHAWTYEQAAAVEGSLGLKVPALWIREGLG